MTWRQFNEEWKARKVRMGGHSAKDRAWDIIFYMPEKVNTVVKYHPVPPAIPDGTKHVFCYDNNWNLICNKTFIETHYNNVVEDGQEVS